MWKRKRSEANLGVRILRKALLSADRMRSADKQLQDDYSVGSAPPSHSLIVRSHEALASRRPSGENVMWRTPAVLPFTVLKCRPAAMSQSLMVSSELPDASVLPSGDHTGLRDTPSVETCRGIPPGGRSSAPVRDARCRANPPSTRRRPRPRPAVPTRASAPRTRTSRWRARRSTTPRAPAPG